jgi:16S rRNA (cytosine967-C5)-methyltransferase
VTDPVRRGALTLLLRYEAGAGYANLLADEERLLSMEPRDRALTVALFYGTVERMLTLDYHIGVLSGRGAASLTPHTRAALRLGLYQLLFMNIPPHAAVSSAVSLGRDRGERALLNGVLRAAAADPARLTPPPRERDLARHLSVSFSIPAPTVRYFLGRLGEEETRALLAAFNTRPPLFLRVNTQKTTREAYLALLLEAGYDAVADPLTPYGLRLSGAVPVSALPGYAEGLFYVQDAASQLAGELLAPRPGETVLDLCACPGGKSFSAAMYIGDSGRVIARDLHASKLPLITEGAARLGLTSVTAKVWDATVPDPALCGLADRIICDVPCSGLGVIAKKPDLRYRGLSSVAELAALSGRILDAAATALSPRGTMVFSTCTLTREENEDTVAAFLSRHPDFTAEDFTLGTLTSEGGMLTLWPHRHGTDGFFMAKLRRL